MGRGPGRPAHPLPGGGAQEDCGLPRRGGAGEGHPEHLQKADGEAGGVVRGLRGGSPGGSPGGAPGGAGAVRPGEGLRGGLCRREGPPGHGGLRRSGAHGGAPAGGGGRSSHRAGPPVVRPVRRDHGGRVPGHQRGAERHLHRPVPGGEEPLPGGGCEAVHLPLPPGRSHHLPGQVPRLCRLHPGGGGGGAAAHPVPELPLPAGGAGGGQLRIPQRHVRRLRRDGLHRRRGPLSRCALPARRPLRRGAGRGGRLRRGGGGEDRPGSHRGPLCGQAHPGAGGRGLPHLRRRGRRAARPPGGHRDFTPLPQHGAPPLRPRPGGAGHPMGGGGRRRLLRRHRGERGPLPAPDRGQPKAGRAPHLRPPLPGVRLLRRPAGGAPGRQSRHRLLRRPGRRRGGGQPGLSGRAGRAALRRGGAEQPRAALAALRPHQSAGGVRCHGAGGGAAEQSAGPV